MKGMLRPPVEVLPDSALVEAERPGSPRAPRRRPAPVRQRRVKARRRTKRPRAKLR